MTFPVASCPEFLMEKQYRKDDVCMMLWKYSRSSPVPDLRQMFVVCMFCLHIQTLSVFLRGMHWWYLEVRSSMQGSAFCCWRWRGPVRMVSWRGRTQWSYLEYRHTLYQVMAWLLLDRCRIAWWCREHHVQNHLARIDNHRADALSWQLCPCSFYLQWTSLTGCIPYLSSSISQLQRKTV